MSQVLHADQGLAFDPELPVPGERLPSGSCDCHFHVFEEVSRYPLASPRSYTPADAPLASYRRMMVATGIERAILVQPSVYGSDHRLYTHLLQAHGDWMRGVAVVRGDTPERELERLHSIGTRGTRINALFAAGAPIHEIERIAERIQPLGWHLQLCVDVHAQPDLLPRVVDLGVPVVVDHMGHFPAQEARTSQGFANLLALLQEARLWVKLSGPYRLTTQRAGFEACRRIVDLLVNANSDSLVWGSDWPHPAIAAPMVNDSALVNAALDWLNDPRLREAVFVHNPSALYWDR